MSTQHKLIEKEGILIDLDESSSQFDLMIWQEVTEPDPEDFLFSYKAGDHRLIGSTENILDESDLVKMAVNLLKVASYGLDPEELLDEIRAECREQKFFDLYRLGDC